MLSGQLPVSSPLQLLATTNLPFILTDFPIVESEVHLNFFLCGKLPSCGKMVPRLSHVAVFCSLDVGSFIYLFTSQWVFLLAMLFC